MTTRSAEPRDYPDFVELFRVLDPEAPVPDRGRWERDFMAHTLVLDGPSGLSGYVYFDLLHDAAYVQQLVVAPPVRRTGVGRKLMLGLATELAGRGVRHWDLNVDGSNVAAVRLYEALGMIASGSTHSLRFSWSLVDALATSVPDVVARRVEPSEDPELEARFNLRRGQLHAGRRKLGRHVVGLFEDGVPVGVAVFAPALPSTFPLCVARPELVAVLLAALRELRSPAFDHTLVAIDDDPDLVELLVRHGADVYRTAARYSGRLPLG